MRQRLDENMPWNRLTGCWRDANAMRGMVAYFGVTPTQDSANNWMKRVSWGRLVLRGIGSVVHHVVHQVAGALL